MGITTTETIHKPMLLCEACGMDASGGVTAAGADGRHVGMCCASAFDLQCW